MCDVNILYRVGYIGTQALGMEEMYIGIHTCDVV